MKIIKEEKLTEKESSRVRALIDTLDDPNGIAKRYGYTLTPDAIKFNNGSSQNITKVQYNRLKELGYESGNPSNIDNDKKIGGRWNTSLKAGVALRRAIAKEDYQGIIDGIRACYKEMLDKGIIDDWDYERWTEDLDMYAPDDEDIEDTLDYELDNLYDACDNLGCWIELDESIKEDLDEKYTRLVSQIKPSQKSTFNAVKKLIEDGGHKVEVDGFYFPEEAVDAVQGTGKNYHLNSYIDLTTSDILTMIRDNDTVEDAIKELFDDYDASSAYSWGSNFLSALDGMSANMDESLNEDLDNVEDIKKAIEWGKNAMKEYRDSGKPVPNSMWDRMIELQDKLYRLVVNKSVTEDLDNVESTDNTVVINQPTGAAEEDSKKYKKRFEDATKEPKDAPLFGAKEQPKPDEVEEPKAELKEEYNIGTVEYMTKELINELKAQGLIDSDRQLKRLADEIMGKLDKNDPSNKAELKESKLALDESLFEDNKSQTKKNLKEEVSDLAYQMADEIDERFREQGFISWDDFNEAFEDAYPGLIDWTDDSFNDLETDVRGILSNMGWETIFEGDDEGSLKLLDESIKEGKLATYKDEDGAKHEIHKIADNKYQNLYGVENYGKYGDVATQGSATFSNRKDALNAMRKHRPSAVKEESLSEASTLPTGGKDEKFDTDAWSVIYWELSDESEGSADRKMARRAKVNAPMDSRYEHVDPVNDFDLRVYASDESGFDLAKKIADAWGVKYKIENTNGVHANKFPEEKLQMTLLIPEEMIG